MCIGVFCVHTFGLFLLRCPRLGNGSFKEDEVVLILKRHLVVCNVWDIVS